MSLKSQSVPQQYEFSDKLVSISIGASSSSNDIKMKDVNSAAFNYNIGYFKQGLDYLIGGIYHVSAYRMYGSVSVPGSTTQSDAFELQSNLNLVGASYRKYLYTTEETSPYLRIDGGLAWATSGKSVIISPFENATAWGLGANLGLGIAFKTDYGSVTLDIYHTLYQSKKVKELDSGMSNLSLGIMF